jgi:SAM-dependent methyltransferase
MALHHPGTIVASLFEAQRPSEVNWLAGYGRPFRTGGSSCSGGTLRSLLQPRALAHRLRFGRKHGQHWVRVVLDREVSRFIVGLGPNDLDAVEISGRGRSDGGWRSYRSVQYPEFDLLEPTPIGQFDVVICEQVLEHVRDPWRAVTTLAGLCRPGGYVIISTPFLLRLHYEPADYWRFSPDGLVELVTGAGLDVIEQGQWGNAWCSRANRRRWIVYRPIHRVLSRWSLADDPLNPQVIWTFAQRPPAVSAPEPAP